MNLIIFGILFAVILIALDFKFKTSGIKFFLGSFLVFYGLVSIFIGIVSVRIIGPQSYLAIDYVADCIKDPIFQNGVLFSITGLVIILLDIMLHRQIIKKAH